MSLATLVRKPVHTIETSAKIVTAARLMCDCSCGALVVTDASGVTPLGILTDRDIVWMVAEGLDPRQVEVGQFLQGPLHTVCVTDTLGEVTRLMREHGVRRLPIVDRERRLLGIVSLDDVLVLLGRELADAAGTIAGEIDRERGIADAARAARTDPPGRT